MITDDWCTPTTDWDVLIDRYVSYRQVPAWRARTRRKNGDKVPERLTKAEAKELRKALQRTVGILQERDAACVPHLLTPAIAKILTSLREGPSWKERCRKKDVHQLWRALILNRHGYTCHHCSRTASAVFAETGTRTLRFELDHRKSRSADDHAFDIGNLVASCLSCNRVKAQLTEERFIEELRSLAEAVHRRYAKTD